MQKKYMLFCALLASSFMAQGMGDDADKEQLRPKSLKGHFQIQHVNFGDGLDAVVNEDLSSSQQVKKSQPRKFGLYNDLGPIIGTRAAIFIEYVILSNRRSRL